MQRWQYFVIQLSQAPNGVWIWNDNGLATPIDQRLNEFGAQGWELCGIAEDYELNPASPKLIAYHFKRPY